MKFVWPAAAAITLVFGFMLTPWQTLIELAASQGVSEDVQSLMWRAAPLLTAIALGTAAAMHLDNLWVQHGGNT